MNSDVMHTYHRRLEMAFKSAAKAVSQGAGQVTIEWERREASTNGRRGSLVTCQYAFEKTSDGIYARVRGIADANELMRVHNFTLQYGLPFSPSTGWERTDGTPVTSEVL